MTKEQSNSILNLGNLGKPADTLVKKISNAVGGIFAPYQVKRLAKAEAEAAVIQAQTDIQITDLHRRAVRRWIEEEKQRQENIETITTTALPLLNGDANAGAVDDDWIVNFFDKSRIVSDGQMRKLWSRILAGEANEPGTYSKRTVNFLSGLDKSEAELFTTLCGFAWEVGTLVPLVFDSEGEIYNKHGINFNSLQHLDAVGLIQFGSLAGFVRSNIPGGTYAVHYYRRRLEMHLSDSDSNELDVGKVMLTRVGLELATVCGSGPVDGFWEYVSEKWNAHLQNPSRAPSTSPGPDAGSASGPGGGSPNR